MRYTEDYGVRRVPKLQAVQRSGCSHLYAHVESYDARRHVFADEAHPRQTMLPLDRYEGFAMSYCLQ